MSKLNSEKYMYGITASSSTGAIVGSGSTTTEILGPLLTVTRIQSIGELIANSINIEETYFSNNDLTSSDYETFLQENGTIITFTDSLGTNYIVPSTFVNWPPGQNGYPYQVMGANISVGPFMAQLNLSSQIEYLSGVIEQITGITPNITLVELSDIYPIDKPSANIIEYVRDNNINGPGTPAYYDNMFNEIQNDMQGLIENAGMNVVDYGSFIPNVNIPPLDSLPDEVLTSSSQVLPLSSYNT